MKFKNRFWISIIWLALKVILILLLLDGVNKVFVLYQNF
jgi:hypothetical protein